MERYDLFFLFVPWPGLHDDICSLFPDGCVRVLVSLPGYDDVEYISAVTVYSKVLSTFFPVDVYRPPESLSSDLAFYHQLGERSTGTFSGTGVGIAYEAHPDNGRPPADILPHLPEYHIRLPEGFHIIRVKSSLVGCPHGYYVTVCSQSTLSVHIRKIDADVRDCLSFVAGSAEIASYRSQHDFACHLPQFHMMSYPASGVDDLFCSGA